jgi:hypothetical protein
VLTADEGEPGAQLEEKSRDVANEGALDIVLVRLIADPRKSKWYGSLSASIASLA